MNPEPERRPEDVKGVCIFCAHHNRDPLGLQCLKYDLKLRAAREICGGLSWERGSKRHA